MDEIPKTTKNSVKEVSKVSIKKPVSLIKAILSYTGSTIGHGLCILWWALRKSH
jgi:hypothetical protein